MLMDMYMFLDLNMFHHLNMQVYKQLNNIYFQTSRLTFNLTYVLCNEYHYMSMDMYTFLDLNMFHYSNTLDCIQLNFIFLLQLSFLV